MIFESRGFRRWKEAWRRSAWLVILDRTSRQSDEAVVLVEQEFVQRRYDDDDPLAAAVSYVSVAEADQMYGIARDHGIRALAIESDEIRAFDERWRTADAIEQMRAEAVRELPAEDHEILDDDLQEAQSALDGGDVRFALERLKAVKGRITMLASVRRIQHESPAKAKELGAARGLVAAQQDSSAKEALAKMRRHSSRSLPRAETSNRRRLHRRSLSGLRTPRLAPT